MGKLALVLAIVAESGSSGLEGVDVESGRFEFMRANGSFR